MGGLALLVAAALPALFVPVGAIAAEHASVPPERAIYRDVRGRVVDGETGQPVAGALVSLFYEMTVSDSAGRFTFDRVPLSHFSQVSVRVRNRSDIVIGCITLDVPVRFYPVAANLEETVEVPAQDGSGRKEMRVITKTDITIVDPSSDEEVVLRLRSVPLAELSKFCTECHGSNPCLETTSYEDVVKTSKDLRGIIVYLDELEAFKEKLQKQGLQRDAYRKLRYQDTHPDGMNMKLIPELGLQQYAGRYAYPAELDLVDDLYVTCGTCHTRHVPTEMKQYVVQPYEDSNKLCFNCHL